MGRVDMHYNDCLIICECNAIVYCYHLEITFIHSFPIHTAEAAAAEAAQTTRQNKMADNRKQAAAMANK